LNKKKWSDKHYPVCTASFYGTRFGGSRLTSGIYLIRKVKFDTPLIDNASYLMLQSAGIYMHEVFDFFFKSFASNFVN